MVRCTTIHIKNKFKEAFKKLNTHCAGDLKFEMRVESHGISPAHPVSLLLIFLSKCDSGLHP